jgi:hypothetical protein
VDRIVIERGCKQDIREGDPIDIAEEPLAALGAALAGPPQVPGIVAGRVYLAAAPAGDAGQVVGAEDLTAALGGG